MHFFGAPQYLVSAHQTSHDYMLLLTEKTGAQTPVFRFFAAFFCHNVRVSSSFLTLFASHRCACGDTLDRKCKLLWNTLSSQMVFPLLHLLSTSSMSDAKDIMQKLFIKLVSDNKVILFFTQNRNFYLIIIQSIQNLFNIKMQFALLCF